MSTPRTPDQPTRQQLDELDALLERMLTLPVQPEEPVEAGPPVTTLVSEPPAVRAPRVGTREQAPVFVATVTADVPSPSDPVPPQPVIAEQRGEPAPKWVPEPTPLDRIIEGPLAAARQEAVEEVLQSGNETPGTEADSGKNVGPSPAKRDEEAVPAVAVPDDGLWRPLTGINAAFDATVGRLGPMGRWLVRPAGRAVLGWSGLLFLAVAVALVVLDRIGWTW